MALNPDGTKLFAVNVLIEPAGLSAYSVSQNATGAITVKLVKSVNTGEDSCVDLAVSWDGSHVYPACGAPYEFDVYDGTTLKQVQTLAATHYPNSAFIDSYDYFVGGVDSLYDADGIYVYGQGGFLIGKVATTTLGNSNGLHPTTTRASGDSTRAISASAILPQTQQSLFFQDPP